MSMPGFRGPGLIRSHRVRGVLVGLWLIGSLAYFVWRVVGSMNPSSMVWTTVFFAAEFVNFLFGAVFFINLIKATQINTGEPPPPLNAWVDIFIATYNEDIELVRQTAIAARNAHLPHHTWICDDGRRPEMRALAEELGVGYFDRPDNAHYKSGNLNNAFQQTSAEFVLVLDADHVVRASILERLLGYFQDERLGLVQIPQFYYNVESFQHVGRDGWHESSMFHHAMQPGAGARNSAFFIGTGALIRRAALLEIGGFATGSITEDIHTSMRLHSRGWGSRYVDEVLGVMLAPETPLAFVVQRLRWAQGGMQLLRMENPLFQTGLSLWQRISYTFSMGAWLASWPRFVFYLAPVIFLLLGASPLAAPRDILFPVLLAKIVLDVALGLVLALPDLKLFTSECFNMINTPIGLVGSLTLLKPHGLKFNVTPKGRQRGLPGLVVFPVLTIMVLEAVSTGVGLARMVKGSLDAALGIFVVGFSAWFFAAATYALIYAYQRRANVEAYAFPVAFPATVDLDGQLTAVNVRRLNASVSYLESPRALTLSTPLTLQMREDVGLWVSGRATVQRRLAKDLWLIRVAHDSDLPREQEDALYDLLFNDVLPAYFIHTMPGIRTPPPSRGELIEPPGNLLQLASPLL